MKYKISLAYNLAIIIGSLIILCILISRGYDIYVILIPILTILASLINLICDIKKHKWFYINATLYSYKVVFFRKQLLNDSASINLTNTLSQTFMDILWFYKSKRRIMR